MTSNTSKTDLGEAQRFLDLLAPDEDVTFQTFSDKKGGGAGQTLSRVLHGRLKDHSNELADLNAQGAGVFFMVNQGDGIVHKPARSCRTARSVIKVRANFVDLDGSPLEPVLECKVAPSIVVGSSPKRWHAYWLVDGETLDQFSTIQRQLSAQFSGDPTVHDLPRVMRLPGFLHRKGEPYCVSILHTNPKEHQQ